jgi:hypothetical protein
MEKYFINNNGKLKELPFENIICTFKTTDGEPYIAYTFNEKNGEDVIIYGGKVTDNNLVIPMEEDEMYIIEDCINLLKEKYKSGGEA